MKPFIWKWILHTISFSCKSKSFSHLDSVWNWGTREHGNGILPREPRMISTYSSFQDGGWSWWRIAKETFKLPFKTRRFFQKLSVWSRQNCLSRYHLQSDQNFWNFWVNSRQPKFLILWPLCQTCFSNLTKDWMKMCPYSFLLLVFLSFSFVSSLFFQSLETVQLHFPGTSPRFGRKLPHSWGKKKI